MLRRIIRIDEQKCNGCGACATACHEGAIGMVDGKAKLLREDYCDGLGDCLPACPVGAIRFETREAAAYDEQAVAASKTIPLRNSALRQWPVQIKLAPMQAAWYENADLLIAADCTAYAYASFHQDFIRDHVVLVGCPKLDGVDYAMKLTHILKNNAIRSVTVARMEVPCCGGLSFAVEKAMGQCEREIPLRVVTISTDGRIVSSA